MDEVLQTNELYSELRRLNKSEREKNKLKLIIGLSLGICLILLTIIIIILVTTINKNNPDNNGRSKKTVIGVINCIYYIETSKDNTLLLGNDFDKNFDFDIYIGQSLIKNKKLYKFYTLGIHEVQIRLYENINMDYMFKNVEGIISVEMKSEKNCQILSMISTFENCEKFKSFKVEGFDASKIKSMSKLFYKTSLSDYHFNSFNALNLQDISYMFAHTHISEFSLNINTEQVINISHLFQECESLISIDLDLINSKNVKDMSYLFSYCYTLESLDFTNFYTNQVIDMSHMFHDCFSLTELYINILIDINKGKIIFPVIYVLMNHKSSYSYIILFQKLDNKKNN